jgi:hypothetical protein
MGQDTASRRRWCSTTPSMNMEPPFPRSRWAAVTKRNAAKVERIAVQERCEVALLQALQAKRWTCRCNRFSAYTQQDLQVDLHKPTSQTRMSADAC